MAGISFNTNLAALRTNRRLGETTAKLQQSFARLSSGLRLNRSADDAAGLSIAEALRTDARIYSQGVRNLNDGISITSIADSTLNELSNIVVRLEELATQSANGTLGFKQRASLDAEAQALSKEYFRISRVASFNGLNLFDGSVASLRFQGGYGINGGVNGTVGGALGTGSFAPGVTFASTGNSLSSLALGDLNGDGIPDLAAAGQNAGAGVAVIQLGNGDGTYGAAFTYSADATNSNAVALGDLNGDGVLDLVTAGLGAGIGRVTVRLGNGNGSFRAATSYVCESTTSASVALGDLNNDGILDLVSAGTNGGTGAATVRLGTGSGAFGSAVSYSQETGYSTAVTLADLNGDGILDLATSGESGSGLGAATIRLGNGDGSFRTAASYLDSMVSLLSLKTGDLNGDGLLDLAAVADGAGEGYLVVRLGNGNGSFRAESQSTLTFEDTYGLALGDVNGDGLIDAVSCGLSYVSGDYYGGVSVQLGNGNGSFRPASTFLTDTNDLPFSAVGLGDLNGDGVLDIASDGSGCTAVDIQRTTPGLSPLLPFSLKTKADALQALPMLKQALARVSSQRGTIGALESRLTTALSTLAVARENFESARSLITDVDTAEESAALLKNRILQQAGVSILSSANQAPALAVQLLSG